MYDPHSPVHYFLKKTIRNQRSHTTTKFFKTITSTSKFYFVSLFSILFDSSITSTLDFYFVVLFSILLDSLLPLNKSLVDLTWFLWNLLNCCAFQSISSSWVCSYSSLHKASILESQIRFLDFSYVMVAFSFSGLQYLQPFIKRVS